jgi:hypothetical protein
MVSPNFSPLPFSIHHFRPSLQAPVSDCSPISAVPLHPLRSSWGHFPIILYHLVSLYCTQGIRPSCTLQMHVLSSSNLKYKKRRSSENR